MSNSIFEELPARKHAPAAGQQAKSSKETAKSEGGAQENSEKKIRQAVYDIRYRARREGIDLRQAFSQYVGNSSLNQAERTAVREKLFGKTGGESTDKSNVKEQYTSSEWAYDNVAKAMFSVFVENNEKDASEIELSYVTEMESKGGTKYKVRVTDNNGKSYVRYASREKITQLRNNSNIKSVEMTEYGNPYEGERKKGTQTAAAKKAKKDYDGDGKVESSSKEHAGAVHNAIQRAKGGTPDGKDTRKEDFLWNEQTGTTSVEGQNARKITGKGVNNNNRVKVFPDDGSNPQNNLPTISAGNELDGDFIQEKASSKAQQRFMGMVYAAKKGEKAASPEVKKVAQNMSKEEAKKYASTKHKGLPEKKEVKEEANCPKCGKCPCECDNREAKTYRELLKNKIRAMGVKNPMVLGDMGAEKTMKIMTSSSAKMATESSCGGSSTKKKKKKKSY
jgi:hypothetical protein